VLAWSIAEFKEVKLVAELCKITFVYFGWCAGVLAWSIAEFKDLRYAEFAKPRC
jgi:hypothetical protein